MSALTKISRPLKLLHGGIRICRPWAAATLAVSVGLSFVFASGQQLDVVRGALTVIITLLIGLAAFPLNDAYDIDIDRVAHAERPIVMGEISVQGARIQAGLMIVTGWMLSWLLGPTAPIAAAVSGLLVICYSPIKATSGVFGNALTAILFGWSLIVPVFVVRQGSSAFILVGLSTAATLIIFAREIAKDIEDIQVDAVNRRSTLATTYGTRASFRIASLMTAATGLVALATAMLWGMWIWYAATACWGVMCFVMSYRLWVSLEEMAKRRVAELKHVMIAFPALVLLGIILVAR